jgi:hypothetical protein
MLTDWNILSDHLQIMLSREALRRAVALIAEQAHQLAEEIEEGAVADRGGPDALRLFASLVCINSPDPLSPAAAC